MFSVMRILDLSTLESYWLAGHNEEDAYNSFGNDIEIKKLVAVPEKDMDRLDYLEENA